MCAFTLENWSLGAGRRREAGDRLLRQLQPATFERLPARQGRLDAFLRHIDVATDHAADDRAAGSCPYHHASSVTPTALGNGSDTARNLI
jgi:hypothetical protein